jgi:hypothetical protein
LRAQEAYYLAIFSSQRPENWPKHSHTFATFVKVQGGCPLEVFTISWLPRGAAVRPLLLPPEQGRNYDLLSTLRLAAVHGERVSMWGPYQILPELYQRALEQKSRLESGAVTYKAVDTGWPARRVSNCIHAVSDLDRTRPPLRIASPGWGDPASYYVTLHLLPWIVDPCRVHDWVFDTLGLHDCCIRWPDPREGNPAEYATLRVFMSVAQHRLERQARKALSAHADSDEGAVALAIVAPLDSVKVAFPPRSGRRRL